MVQSDFHNPPPASGLFREGNTDGLLPEHQGTRQSWAATGEGDILRA